MQGDSRPEKSAAEPSRETDISKIESYRYAVDQHAGQRRTWPAGSPERDQSDARHARDWDGDAGKFLSEQHLPNERRNHQQRKPGYNFGSRSDDERFLHRGSYR